MTESDKGTTVERMISNESGPKLFRPPKLYFASCVDSIKEGIRKISGFKEAYNVDGGKAEEEGGGGRKSGRKITVVGAALPAHPLQQSQGLAHRATVQGGQILGVRRKRGKVGGRGGGDGGSRTSFEMFLSTIPKLDPVDRTVGWVFTQPDEEVQELQRDSYANLPSRGSIAPQSIYPPPLPSTHHHRPMNSRGYETSVSRCESDRGTGGRGTPPSREVGQPRLDDLFRQLQLKQEHEARRRLARVGAPPITSHNLLNLDIDSSQVPGYPAGITPELLPFLPYQRRMPAALVHKNSFYYNQGTMPSGVKLPPQPPVSSLDYICEWQRCRMRFLTAKELLGHVEEEHIGRLPTRVSGFRRRAQRNSLACQWKGCAESSRVFVVRYKLLLHMQQSHCRERVAPQKNTNTTTAQPHSARSDTKPSPPAANNVSCQITTDSPPTRVRKPPTRTQRTSIDNRTILVGRKVLHPPPEVIPELLIEAQPVIAKRRKQTHIPQQPMEYMCKPDRIPER